MSRRENLLVRLQGINPVPDPSRIYEDVELADRLALARSRRDSGTLSDRDLERLAHRRVAGRPRWAVAAAAAVLALVVGATVVFVGDPAPDVGAGSRTLDVRFEGTAEGAACTITGPTSLVAGEIEIIFRNESATPGTDFMDFVRLDPGRTEQDVRDFVSEPFIGRPTWTTPVAQFDVVEQGVVSRNDAVKVEPGRHALVCGANMAGGGIQPEFAVVAGIIEVVPAK